MAFRDFLERWFPTTDVIGGETVIIDIPASVYYKELALYTGTSLIANAISRSEVKTYEKNKEVQDKDYYLLNISPNANQSSSQFWHKVISKIIREGSALGFELSGSIYCADSFNIKGNYPILGNTFDNVVLESLTLSKVFTSKDVYHFHMNNQNVKALVDGLYEEYGKVLSTAIESFKRSNGKKYKLHIEGVKAGSDDFQSEFKEVIKKQLKDFMENDNAIYPEFDGYLLEPVKSESAKSVEDIIKLREEIFGIVGDALKIPQSLMAGNINNMNDIVKVFLTFSVDPYADMITEVLNKRAGFENWKDGSRYLVDTGRISHRDIFDVATDMEKLISSGALNIDEVRKEIGYEELGTDWSQQHWMTKNFAQVEDLLEEILKGGE